VSRTKSRNLRVRRSFTVKGHLVQATYSFTDFLNFQFTYYLNDLIINAPGQSSNAGHFMVDLNWRF